MTRRDRLARLARVGFIASQAANGITAAEPVAMPLDLARQVQAFAAAARAVAELAEREIAVLEESRDWGDAA